MVVQQLRRFRLLQADRQVIDRPTVTLAEIGRPRHFPF
jgi:hypothetical protein